MANLRVNVDTNTDRLRRSNGRFLAGLPEMEEDTAKEFADDMADNIRDSIRRKFRRFDGDLEQVEVKPRKNSGGGVKFTVNADAYNSEGVNYAAWHEFAKSGHTAPVEGELKRWAADRGILKDIGTGLEVTPMNQQEGSFMQPAIQKAISEQRKNLRTGRNAVSEGLRKHFGG